MKHIRLSLLPWLLIPLWFVGCSLPDFKSTSPPVTRWRLAAEPPPRPATQSLACNLVITPVSVAPGLEHDVWVVLDPPSRYEPIRNAGWPTDLPDYLRRQLILDLANSGHFASVLRNARSDLPNRMLMLRLRDFQLEREDGGLRVHLRIEVGVWALKGKGTLLHRWYEVAEPVPRMQMADISTAWNRAWGRFLGQLVADLDRALQPCGLSPPAGR